MIESNSGVLLLFGHLDDLADIIVNVFLCGVEIANSDANDVVALELGRSAEAFFDVLDFTCHSFGQLERDSTVFIFNLEEDDGVLHCVDAEQCGMSLNGGN